MGAVRGGQGWKQVRGNAPLPAQDKRLYSLTRLSPKLRRPSKLAVLAVGGTLVLAGAGTAAAVTLQSPQASLSAAATGLDADSLHSSSSSSTAAKAAASISAAAADKAAAVKAQVAAVKAQAAAEAAAEKVHAQHVAHAQHTELLAEQARAAAQKATAAKAAAQQAAAQAAATQQAQATSETSSSSSGSSSSSSSSSNSSSSTTPSGSPQEVAQQLLAQDGESSQWSCLDQLWQQESGWSITAENAGSGAYGIPQALPGSKMAADGPDWQTDATTQIKWGLSYIASNYGSPCSAWSHEEADGWY
jgi:hypothetical protein